MKNKLKHILYLSLLLFMGINAWASWNHPMIGGAKARQSHRLPTDVIQAKEPDTVVSRFPVARTVPQDEGDLRKKNMDLRSPENIKPDTIYDAKTNTYIIGKKVGDGYLSAPILMTAEEYQQWTLQQSLRDYYRQKNQEAFDSEGKNKFDFTNMQFDLGPAEKIFAQNRSQHA